MTMGMPSDESFFALDKISSLETPFEKDCCPYSRAVMDGISLDIEDGSEASFHEV